MSLSILYLIWSFMALKYGEIHHQHCRKWASVIDTMVIRILIKCFYTGSFHWWPAKDPTESCHWSRRLASPTILAYMGAITEDDRQILVSGKCLTASHISAAQHLMRTFFPHKMDWRTRVPWKRSMNGRHLLKNSSRLSMCRAVTGHAFQTNAVQHRTYLW